MASSRSGYADVSLHCPLTFGGDARTEDGRKQRYGRIEQRERGGGLA